MRPQQNPIKLKCQNDHVRKLFTFSLTFVGIVSGSLSLQFGFVAIDVAVVVAIATSAMVCVVHPAESCCSFSGLSCVQQLVVVVPVVP